MTDFTESGGRVSQEAASCDIIQFGSCEAIFGTCEHEELA